MRIKKKIDNFLNLFTISDVKNTFIKLFIIIIIIPILLKYIYYKLTKFTIEIVVKEKYKIFQSKAIDDTDNIFFIEDIDGRKFNITNLFFKYDFNKVEDWYKLEKGEKYIAYGYGINYPLIGLYTNIYEFKKY